MKKKQKRQQDNFLPDPAQIRGEEKQAEAKGLHRVPLDPTCEPCMILAASGKLDNQLEPTIEDLTR